MNIKYLGTKYGGWHIDIDSINDGDYIIDGGIGEDISFDEELLKLKNVNIIAIDPTIKSHIFLEKKSNDNILLIKKAIARSDIKEVEIFKNTNPNYVSESVYNTHNMTGKDSYKVETISISELKDKFKPTLIKIDIEGSEYSVFKECIGVKQICIEFHHHCLSHINLVDTKEVIKYFEKNGYTVIHSTPNNQEVTFLKQEG